jgi:CspA family cold shock protein
VGKGNSYREPRRRGFDDDNFSPPPFLQRDHGHRPSSPPAPRFDAPGGPVITATVKWFNAEKGFGFVGLADGSDAFLHIRALEQAGHSTVSPGATLQVRTGQGQKGPQVTEVLEVDESTASAAPPRRERAPGPPRTPRTPDLSTAVELEGSVKWYNPTKGFGFVEVGDGGKDVFVHASALERSGVGALIEGQRVTVRVVQGQKGREAASVTVTGYA